MLPFKPYWQQPASPPRCRTCPLFKPDARQPRLKTPCLAARLKVAAVGAIFDRVLKQRIGLTSLCAAKSLGDILLEYNDQ